MWWTEEVLEVYREAHLVQEHGSEDNDKVFQDLGFISQVSGFPGEKDLVRGLLVERFLHERAG